MNAARTRLTIRRLIQSAPFAAICVLAAACTVEAADDDDEDDDEEQGPQVVAMDCDAEREGALRCSGTLLEQCQGGAWVQQSDCLMMGMACEATPETGARCIPPDGPDSCSPEEAGQQRCADKSIISECNGSEWVVVNDCSVNGETCKLATDHFVCEYVEPIEDCGTVTDAHGNEYETVVIAGRCWMRHNLNIGTAVTDIDYCNDETDCFGAPICEYGQCTGALDGNNIRKWCQDNHPAMCEPVGGCGGAYRWFEVMQGSTSAGAQGICPAGWHVPTRIEWDSIGFEFAGHATNLIRFFGGHPFQAILCGKRRDMTTMWDSEAQRAYFWTSNGKPGDPTEAYVAVLERDNENVSVRPLDKNFGIAVRCIKD